MNIDTTSLARLADTTLNAELNALGVTGVLPEQFRESLERLQAEQKRELTDQAARSVLALIKQSESHTMVLVDGLRRTRREEARIRANLHQLNRAKAYGAETGNFLPLAVILGQPLPEITNNALLSVPQDWKDSKTAEESGTKPAAETTKPARQRRKA